MDDDESRSLDFKEFKKGIHDYGILMEDSVIKELFERLDADSSGQLDFDEFLKALRVRQILVYVPAPHFIPWH